MLVWNWEFVNNDFHDEERILCARCECWGEMEERWR